jgi:glycosyltransferase involved in cell wall biosynthesis
MSPGLSIVIAVRDGAEWIGDAIRSAEGADGLLEIIVVDDGSTDDGGAVAAASSDLVRVLRTEPVGLPAAHNLGVGSSRGSLVAFLDADDLWAAGRPDPRRARLRGAGGVWGRVQCMVDGRPHGEPFHLGGMGGLLLRRRVLEEVGPFDEELLRGHDLDWLLRAEEHGVRLPRVDDVVLRYTLRPGSLSDVDGPRASVGLLAALGRRSGRRREASR